MSPTDLVVVGLASWRLAHLLVEETGPFDLIVNFRKAIGANDVNDAGLLNRLFLCVLCMSGWTTPALMLCWWSGVDALAWIVIGLACWGFAAALHLLTNRS